MVQLVRLPSRRDRPLAFADGGATAHAEPDSRDGYELAVTLGATGLAGVVRTTADGVLVVSSAEALGRWPRRIRIGAAERAQLDALLDLDGLRALAGERPIALTVPDHETGEALVASVPTGREPGRWWLCHHDVEALVGWHERRPDLHAVHTTHVGALERGPERHVAELARRGIGGISLPGADWSGGLTTLTHRFDLDAVARAVRVERVATDLVRMGIDAVFTGEVETVVEVITAEAGPVGA